MNANDEETDRWNSVEHHVRRVEAPRELSEIQVARIARRVFDSPRPRRSRAPLAIAFSVVLGAAAVYVARLGRARIAVVQPSLVQSPVHRGAPGRMAVIGTGVSAPLAEGPLVMRDGRIALRTGDGAVTVGVPDGSVAVPAHALVEIVVQHLRTQIAAYRGSATLSTDLFTLTIPAGRATTNDGMVVAADDRADFLERALAGHEPLPAAEAAHQPEARHRAPTAAAPPTIAATAEVEQPIESDSTAPQLGDESELVGVGLAKLNAHDAAAALQLTDEYAMRFPGGQLAGEAAAIRAQAFAQLGRKPEALNALDAALRFAGAPKERLLLIRGELLASDARCAAAIADFDAVVRDAADVHMQSRALFDRGACRAELGDHAGARSDLEAFLATSPTGPNAAAARRALGE